MLTIVIEEEGRPSRTVSVNRFPCRIGRGREVEVPLAGWRVARVHAELHRVGLGIKLVDMGTIIGTRVNGERVVEYGPLSSRDEILVAGYRIHVQEDRRPDTADFEVERPEARDGCPSSRAERMGDELPQELADSWAHHVTAEEGVLSGVQSSSRLCVTEGARFPAEAVEADEKAGFEVGGAVHAEGRPSARPPLPSKHLDVPRPAESAASAVSGRARVDGQLTGTGAGRSGPSRVDGERLPPSVMAAPSVIEDAAIAADGASDEHANARARRSLHEKATREQARALGWRRMVHRQLLEMIDLRRSNLAQYSTEQLRAEVQSAVEGIVAALPDLPVDIDRAQLVQDTVDEAVGLGPLERLMDDPLVSEIMVNSATDIFIERQGRLEQVPLAFSDDDAIRNVIERIVAPLGRRIDESSPLVDARLPDGSRVNAIIPPVALKGPTITIRRFNRTVMTPQTLVANGSASAQMMAFLSICVREQKSIIVSGGTGSGKTTLLNVLSNLIPLGERLITIEDAAELKLAHPHLVSLESRPPNAEGRGAITIRDLVKNALRMRPDRIIVGECRGAEALDMMQAMNTGHEGSLTTIHANAPRDVLSRLEVLMLMAGLELPLPALREQVASAVDLIVHQARFPDGSRRITSITEVCGVESGRIQTQEIFRFEQTGRKHDRVQGRFVATQQIPSFYEALRDRGVAVDLGIFEDREGTGGHDGPRMAVAERALAGELA
ncbi:MAG: ATPase, T2SS/T4P/T4SS family [Lautropia sp.]|nr:ATPase, T2SS/T4P/T4SS family [Lautropia sp.]